MSFSAGPGMVRSAASHCVTAPGDTPNSLAISRTLRPSFWRRVFNDWASFFRSMSSLCRGLTATHLADDAIQLHVYNVNVGMRVLRAAHSRDYSVLMKEKAHHCIFFL